MKTLQDLEREAREWQEDAAYAHVLAGMYPESATYWQLKGRRYSTLAIVALDACNIMRAWQ